MRFSVVVAVTAGLLAGACADYPVTTGSFRGGANPMFTYAAAARDLRTVVIGNPFPAVPQQEIEAAAIAAMQGRFRAQPTNLVLAPTASSRPDSRLVLALDPRPGLSAERLCGSGEPAQTAAGGRLSALLAFCYRDIPYAEVRGNVTRPQSPRDPAFTRLLATMAGELLPGADATMQDFMDNAD